VTYLHLAFKGARYAICGATVNERNRATTVAVQATCPGCREELDTAERVHAALHSGRGKRVTAEYEV
jgi:hypothetical protein